jgi:PhzF family phenazine biosynthesis protein
MPRIVQVDAFTSKPFGGNPAAVCVLPGPAEDDWMRNVALEMNLSETAFLYPKDSGFSLRWFTPAVEVALCGHATLASAHVLWQDGHLPKGETARFHTKSGLLTAVQKNGSIEMDFPATPNTPEEPPPGMIEALGLENPVYIGRNKFDYLVEAESEAVVRGLSPDHSKLRKMSARGIIVTARGDGYDFVSRFFAPGSGIDEDPVTGSAHCALGPYWAKKLGKNTFRAYQASPRGGEVGVRVEGDRCILSGKAVTVLQGELLG